MSRLLPLPTDVFRKVDAMLVDVGEVLGRVDGTLGSVDTTLASVDTTLDQVRDLLAELHDQLALLEQVPTLALQLDEVHRAVLALAAAQDVDVPAASSAAPRAGAGSRR